MKTFIGAIVLSAMPATAFAIFTVAPLPEPGALELVVLGGVVLVAVRFFKRKK